MTDSEGWFEESQELEEGITTKIKIEKRLHTRKSKFQRIDVYETTKFGSMLALDGVIMLTEFDEFCYHEMITHVPLITHPNPKKVLVIGGGDGGAIREILKHKCVKEAHMCEIDEEVVNVSKEYFPSVSNMLDDKRVTLYFEDGAKFVQEHKGEYDIIIVDSSDPIGPAQVLFRRPFYEGMKSALRDEGIIVSQAESFFLHEKIIRGMNEFIKDMFPIVDYYYTNVATYPSGLIGFYFCSLKADPTKPKRIKDVDKLENLRFYSEKMHESTFVLPQFVEEYFE